ncbi:MAG: sugar phosphate isomerase/epimerase [Thermomicrobiales bacterium]|nr:sugar phosphate isomerase/epimerase [Thermomicrobiales bacterium]
MGFSSKGKVAVTVKIAISSYSFSGFKGDGHTKYDFTDVPDVLQMIDHCVEWGLDGIEFLNEHLTLSGVTTPEKLAELAQYAAIRGIRIVTLAASNNALQPSPQDRADDLAQLIEHIDWANILGAPFVRVLGGRWGTITDFAELTANKGGEPPIEGYTHEDGLGWTVSSLRYAAGYAGRKGITLVLENHWGPTGTAAGAKEIHDAVNSPYLKFVLDTGNFFHLEDQYAEMEVFTEDLAMVHAKMYLGGSRVGVPGLDYARIRRVLDKVNYAGYVSIEFEGFATPLDGILDGIETARTYL